MNQKKLSASKLLITNKLLSNAFHVDNTGDLVNPVRKASLWNSALRFGIVCDTYFSDQAMSLPGCLTMTRSHGVFILNDKRRRKSLFLKPDESICDEMSGMDLPQIYNNSPANFTPKDQGFEAEEYLSSEIPQCIPFLGTPANGRTISVALPCSILDNAQTFELKAYLIGQISRALTIFGVDEVVIYEDSSKAVNMGRAYDLKPFVNMYQPFEQNKTLNSFQEECQDSRPLETENQSETKPLQRPPPSDILSSSDTEDHENECQDLPKGIEHFDDRKWSNSMYMFVANLAYLETPQYIRRSLFKMNSILRMVGLQNPLDAPHHPRANDWIPYREGIVISPPTTKKASSEYSFVDCGLLVPCRVRGSFCINTRVTVRFHSSSHAQLERAKQCKRRGFPRMKRGRYQDMSFLDAIVVDSREPTDRYGLYWGYRVRAARHLREALYQCPFNNSRYDLIIGTSERGQDFDPAMLQVPDMKKHILVVLGPLGGLEECLEDELSEIPSLEPESVFDRYINIYKHQKSRTIRTEEALLITLTLLRSTSFPS